MTVGESFTFNPSVLPEGADQQVVIWSHNDTATVTGPLTIVAGPESGTAIIQIESASNPEYFVTVAITIIGDTPPEKPYTIAMTYTDAQSVTHPIFDGDVIETSYESVVRSRLTYHVVPNTELASDAVTLTSTMSADGYSPPVNFEDTAGRRYYSVERTFTLTEAGGGLTNRITVSAGVNKARFEEGIPSLNTTTVIGEAGEASFNFSIVNKDE